MTPDISSTGTHALIKYHRSNWDSCSDAIAQARTSPSPAREVVDFLVSLCEVHEALVMVVVVWALGRVDRQQQVVGAEAVTLCV